jgi:tripartite-type tricarboxylate transporter receptor subunit TctC
MRAATNNAGLFCRALLGALIALALALNASAQTFPIKDKPITIVVPFSAGGPTDRLARDMAEGLRKPLGGAHIVVENILGAGGAIATQKVAKAAPDGHTILIHHIGMATMPSLVRKLGFDVDNDFTYLGMIHEVPMTIVARPSLEAKDYKELTAWVAKNKDKVNLGNAGVGSASHLCGLLWQSSLRTEMVGIPYKGVSMAITDLMAGQIDLLCDQTTNTMAYIETNKIKAFAVTSPKRLSLPSLSKLPTMQELGVKGFQVSIWHGTYAPKGLSPKVQAQWHAALRTVLSDPAFVKKQETLGAVMISDKRIDPEGHRKFVLSEITKWSPIIKAAGVYADQ